MDEDFNLELIVENQTYFNYTFCLNKYSFLNKITIQNITEDLENITLRVISDLGIFETLDLHIDKLEKESKEVFADFKFNYNLQFLKQLNEKDLDTIRIEIIHQNEIIRKTHFALDILPMDYFGGLHAYPQLLASYILSNHPLIYKIKAEAISILEQNNYDPSFEGYQKQNKERILQMVSAIYKAVQNLELIYSSMPPSFEKTGQRIRLVNQVIESKFGNCIDISLLFAACLEAINLNPILVITHGHAFVGVWLQDQRFDSMINFDQAAISKRIASGIKEITLIECTNLCKGSSIPFRTAMNTAETTVMNVDEFLLSIDVKNARSNGISPIPLLKNDLLISETDSLNSKNNSSDLDEDLEIGTVYEDLELLDLSGLTKQKIWERKLLDLSLRNNLLNIRFTKSMLQLVDLQVNLLEDNLAEGKSYTIHPNQNQPILRRYNLYHDPIHSSQPLFQLANDEFKYNKILTYYHQDDLDSILTNLYRSSKLAEEENGKSTLYLGIGLLKWFEPRNKEQPRFAPILLIPVELSRKSVNSKYLLRSREEETMINITLLEYLKQEFKLNLNQLETLPTDDFGVDVPKVLAIIRNAILNLEGWDVLNQTVLGTFSFNKLILWQDISKYSEEIQKSFIVKSLIDGKLTENLENVDNDAKSLENISASELQLPISTDNSQLNAVRNANLNKSFILHGPPGTGKSQTITNIIADALANNKKVLFVAAKKAALDVVHNRLENIGIGAFCLELHSNKSKKSDVLKQFERTVDVPKYQINTNFEEQGKRLDDRKKEISHYVNLLHKSFPSGWTLFDTISFLESHQVKINEKLITSVEPQIIDVATWNSWNDWLIPFSAIVKKIGQPSSHHLSLIKTSVHRYENKDLISKAIENFISQENKSKSVETELELKENDNNPELLEFIENNKIKTSLIDLIFDENENNQFRNWLTHQNKLQQFESEIESRFNTGIYNLDSQSLAILWNQSKHTWFLPKWLKQRNIRKQLTGYIKSKIENDSQIDLIFSQLGERSQLKDQLQNPQYQSVKSKLNYYFTGNSYDLNSIRNDIQVLENLQTLSKNFTIDNFPKWLLEKLNFKDFNQKLPEYISIFKEVKMAREILLTYLYEIPKTEDLKTILINMNLLEDWVNFNILKEKSSVLNLDWFIGLLNQNLLDTDNIDNEFKKIIHLNYFVKTVYNSEILNGFDANIYESLISQYKSLHQEFTTLTKNQLIAKLSQKIPNFTQESAQSSEIGILQKAIRNKGRGLSIRKLFDQIPTLIPRLKPCMLMSPISVAQYFDVNNEHFDLVIFDEASQLPTSEAISALARAKQAIIVGDPKQMPPTSFFSSSKVDEDNMEMEDLESILDDCLALSIPSNYLLRHYRSKHESLISFSNSNFYDNKLLTFPSPDDMSRKVTFDFVEGFYDKGKTRTNKNEAAAIISYIQKHLEKQNKKSIGVVTFSQTQQSLIEDLLQKLFQEKPLLEEFASGLEDPIFIKNLENVQGDERDIILFSIGYGPDEEGKVSMNFGPLNRDGGWRRLNVAVTRARFEMKVFSSLRGDQIDLSRTKSEGVSGLKKFLNFAEKGISLKENHSESNERQSLVDSIASHLESADIKVKTNIGTSGYKVDIGVLNPENEQEFLLAILVDSENYFNIDTTNDRELLAPSVLKNLGWNVFSIWTLDWIKNKETIVLTIKTLLKDIISNKHLKKEEETFEESFAPINLSVLENIGSPSLKKDYISAELIPVQNANSESIYFFENGPVLLSQMTEIINTEAPISQNYLFKKILKLWNTSRAGSKLNNYLIEIVNQVPQIIVTETSQKFYWNQELTPQNIINYRDNSIEKRTIDDIAPEEIAVALMEIMNSSLSVNRDELIKFTAKKFDFLKVGTQIDSVIRSVIADLINRQILRENENSISLF